MKNIYSNIFKFNNKNLSKTLKYLRRSNIVGLPTETVYGLAGNAYSSTSVKKIYKLKKRPRINPLIIHYYDLSKLYNDVEINKNFLMLYKYFCPGPITFIMKKKKSSKISKFASGNLKTVGVRFPNNKIIRKILKRINFPLAMPSANKANAISPVTASDVADEFGKDIKIIIDGRKSKIGIESTVLDLTKKPNILRPGAIGREKIEKILKKKIINTNINKKIKSPGMFRKHYSPNIPMILNKNRVSKNHAFITFGKRYKKSLNTFNLSENSNLYEAARNLYKLFRKIKKMNYKKIYVAKIPNKGIGKAINDRLKKAAGKK